MNLQSGWPPGFETLGISPLLPPVPQGSSWHFWSFNLPVFAAFRKTIRWRPRQVPNFHFHRKFTVRLAVRAPKLEEFHHFYPPRRAPGGPAGGHTGRVLQNSPGGPAFRKTIRRQQLLRHDRPRSHDDQDFNHKASTIITTQRAHPSYPIPDREYVDPIIYIYISDET